MKCRPALYFKVELKIPKLKSSFKKERTNTSIEISSRTNINTFTMHIFSEPVFVYNFYSMLCPLKNDGNKPSPSFQYKDNYYIECNVCIFWECVYLYFSKNDK